MKPIDTAVQIARIPFIREETASARTGVAAKEHRGAIRGIILAAVLGMALIGVFFPIFLTSHSFEPACMRHARDFAYATGQAIKRFAYNHGGRPPQSLEQLYPIYTIDSRVTDSIARFAGELATIHYSQPDRLGDARLLVLEIRWLNAEHNRGLRPVRLWGDLHRPRRP